ncbi:MAG: O-antigen ligase family protein [Acidimicrobiales bacterium]
MFELATARSADYVRLILRYWFVPVSLLAVAVGFVATADPSPAFRATGRIGFVSEVSYFELEPVRNALVSRLQADDFVAELRQRQPGSDAVELLGDEAYRPLGFFDLEGRGDDADLVVRTTQTALDLLREWINEQRRATSMSEPVEVIELRPVGDATQPWRGSRLMGAAVAGLLLGVALVLVVKGDDLPVRTGLGRPGAGLFLVCVAAPFSSDSLDTVLRPSVDVAQLLILVTGSGMALGALALSTADVLAPVRRMPSAAYLALPAVGLLIAPRAIDAAAAQQSALGFLVVGTVVVAVIGRVGLERATSPLIAALVVSLTLGVLIEAFGPRTELTQFFAADDGAFGYGRLRGGFADPNAAGRAAAALVVLCAGVAHRSTVWITGLGVAAAGLLVATQSRTAAIGGVVAIVVLIGARRDSRRFARRTSSAAAVVLFALFVVVAALAASPTARDLFERDDNPGELVTLTGRTQIWAASAEAWARQPLVGYGFGNSEDVLTEARRLGMIDNAVAHAHNAVLQIMLTSGVLGLASLGSIALWLRRQSSSRHLPPSTLALGALVAVFSVTESVFASRIDWTDLIVFALLAELGRTSRLALD